MALTLRPEHVLAAILSSTEDGVLLVSLDGTIQSCSAGAERLYGYSAAEMIGQSLTMLLPIYAALRGVFDLSEKRHVSFL